MYNNFINKKKFGKADIIIIIICCTIVLFIVFQIILFFYLRLDNFFGGPRTASIVGKKVDEFLENKYKEFNFQVTKTVKDITNTNDWFCDVDVYKKDKAIFSTTIQYESDDLIISDNFDYDLNEYNKNLLK